MERVTEWYDDGLREGVLVKEKRGEKETKVLFEEVDDGYHAMCTLKAYEDTGLTPEQIQEIDRLYAEKCQEVAKLRQRDMPERPKILEEIQKSEDEYINEDHHPMFKLGAASIAEEIKEIIKKYLSNESEKWIPVNERLPENGDYILISFENFAVPDIGRYEHDEEGGAFYPGDEDYTYASLGLFVNAWRLLPEPYRLENEEVKYDEK